MSICPLCASNFALTLKTMLLEIFFFSRLVARYSLLHTGKFIGIGIFFIAQIFTTMSVEIEWHKNYGRRNGNARVSRSLFVRCAVPTQFFPCSHFQLKTMRCERCSTYDIHNTHAYSHLPNTCTHTRKNAKQNGLRF